jgi:hypothetical protein
MFCVFRVHEQELRCGRADFGAGSHESKVLGFDMLAAFFKTVDHGHAEARLIALQTGLYTSFGIAVIVIHG